jgi:hypothetical protein
MQRKSRFWRSRVAHACTKYFETLMFLHHNPFCRIVVDFHSEAYFVKLHACSSTTRVSFLCLSVLRAHRSTSRSSCWSRKTNGSWMYSLKKLTRYQAMFSHDKTSVGKAFSTKAFRSKRQISSLYFSGCCITTNQSFVIVGTTYIVTDYSY